MRGGCAPPTQIQEDEMTAMPVPASPQRLFESDATHGKSKFDRKLIVVAALFLAVAIVELAIIVLASSDIVEIGSLCASTT
jgi:hypothetical protein